MARKAFAALIAAMGLMMETVVKAQDAEVAPSSKPGASMGYRVERDEGFQLVTHGVWQVPAPTGPQRLPPAGPTSLQSMGDARIGRVKSEQTNFRRAAYLPHVRSAEAQFRLPSGLLDALIWTESRYNPLAVSSAGAAGLGQLMPATARTLGVANRFDGRANLWAAAQYLRQMLDKFGVVHLALAAYNAGPGAVERAGGIPLNGETPAYVRNVLAFWEAR